MYSLMELNGIELGASRYSTTESVPTIGPWMRKDPAWLQTGESPKKNRKVKLVELNGIEPSAS